MLGSVAAVVVCVYDNFINVLRSLRFQFLQELYHVLLVRAVCDQIVELDVVLCASNCAIN